MFDSFLTFIYSLNRFNTLVQMSLYTSFVIVICFYFLYCSFFFNCSSMKFYTLIFYFSYGSYSRIISAFFNRVIEFIISLYAYYTW